MDKRSACRYAAAPLLALTPLAEVAINRAYADLIARFIPSFDAPPYREAASKQLEADATRPTPTEVPHHGCGTIPP